MAKYYICAQIFESIIKSLINLEEDREIIFQEFSKISPGEQEEIDKMLNTYIKELEQFLSNANKINTNNRELPFIIINSEIEVENIINLEKYKFRLVSPLKPFVEIGDVSFLAPLGKSLLLKKIGDIVKVSLKEQYKILSIKATM